MTNDISTEVLQLSLLSRTRELMANFAGGLRMVVSPVRGFSGRPKAIREIRISQGTFVVRINLRPDGTVAVVRPLEVDWEKVVAYIDAIRSYEGTLDEPEAAEVWTYEYVEETIALLAKLPQKWGRR